MLRQKLDLQLMPANISACSRVAPVSLQPHGADHKHCSLMAFSVEVLQKLEVNKAETDGESPHCLTGLYGRTEGGSAAC